MITITRVLDDIINHQQIPLDRILSRYFSPGYRQRTDNKWEGLDGFAQHARRLREIIAFAKEGANKQVISSQADSLIKISRIWAD
ncbi:hypothetical protein ACOWYO_14880, partial [Klebsiella pneumoniae]